MGKARKKPGNPQHGADEKIYQRRNGETVGHYLERITAETGVKNG